LTTENEIIYIHETGYGCSSVIRKIASLAGTESISLVLTSWKKDKTKMMVGVVSSPNAFILFEVPSIFQADKALKSYGFVARHYGINPSRLWVLSQAKVWNGRKANW
jgi:hypothetical protein